MLNAVISLIIGLGTLIWLPSLSVAQDKQIYINVGEASVKKSLLALPTFQNFGSNSSSAILGAGKELYDVVYNDLLISSLFTFIKQDAFLEDTSKTGLKPKSEVPNGFEYPPWKTINTDFLVRGGYRVVGNKLSFEVYLYYIPQAKPIFGRTYEGEIGDVRNIAHSFTNDVIKNLTGKKGIFKTKLVAASNRDSGKFKEIFIMDWDGANPKKVSNHRSIAMSPAWSPDMKKIAYTAFAFHQKAKVRNADLFMYELSSGNRWLVSYRKGINSGAAFMPDGRHLLLTVSQGGSPDIFRMTLDGKTITPLTKGPNGAMNVEPAVSADGSQLAFSSDRSNQPMIYVMGAGGELDGSKAKRRTFAGKYNASPSWSPDGKKIAFAGFDKGHFDIFVMNADGTGIQRLTDAKKSNGKSADNEDPTFSPDGRHVIYVSNRTGHNQIYLVNVDGTGERQITYDRFDYFKPKWSPMVD